MVGPTWRQVLVGAGLAAGARWGGALLGGVVMLGGKPQWAARMLTAGPPRAAATRTGANGR